MNRNRLYFGLLILVLVITIVWTSVGMLGVNMEEKTYNVSVIVNDSNNDRYIAMREGLEQAAKDNNIQINYVSTGVLVNEKEESALIQREVENGADGIVVQLISSEDTYEIFDKLEASVAVMLLETDSKAEGMYALTAPDNMKIGQLLAQAAIDDNEKNIAEKKIGILCGNQNQLSMQQRLKGVEETLQENKAQAAWTLLSSQELEEVQKKEPVDILITLGNDETEAAVDYLLSETGDKKRFSIYGEGCSEKAVYYLDKGIITALVVPNEFNMGYQSIYELSKQLKYRLSSADSTVVDSLLVDKDNLYDEENQKILFPIVQ